MTRAGRWACGLSLAALLAGLPRAQGDPVFTSPPGEESAAMRALIDGAAAALATGRNPSDTLADPALMPAHEWPRFRRLIRDHAREGPLAIVPAGEPGEPLVVRGTVRNATGGPAAGALIYVYQTSAKGWYSDRAPHVSGMGGDTGHARLFGYLRTGADGTYEVRTIRPAGYPGSDLPAHIHVHVETGGETQRRLVTEILFEDDPRLTPAARERAVRERFVIRPVSRDPEGAARVSADFTMP